MTQTKASAATDSRPEAAAAADAVLMVRPAAFRLNEVTRPTNSFQSSAPDEDPERTAARARKEFDNLASALEQRGIDTRVFPGRNSIELPDEVFPNNWVSTHPDGTVVLYPLMAWNRREERRRDILDQLQQQTGGFLIERIVDLSRLEQNDCFLEGTGSLVLDHQNRIAYASLSPRTHVDALREFGRELDYDIVVFSARGEQGRAIYHTNCMLSLGEQFAVTCLESIPEVDDRLRLSMRLERSGREVIELRADQLKSFCANLLQLRAGDQRLIVLSKQALQALDQHQLDALGRHGELVCVDVATIEACGGGSVRCMLTELRLPRKARSAD